MRRSAIFRLLLLIVWTWAVPVAMAADQPSQTLRIKGQVRFVQSLATYGILSDEGKAYHPIKKLPRTFQKDGLAVVVEGRLRPDLVGARMYGVAFEVTKIEKAELYISPEERDAIPLLLARMDAFNNKDLAKLRSIDTMARNLTWEQFDAWRTGWGNYTLHYLEATTPGGGRPGDKTIAGYCLYSRTRVNSMALSGDQQYAILNFTLAKKDGAWLFTETSAFKPSPDQDMDALIADLLAKAKVRFGTTNLAEWKG
jgi:hypothetical protein